MRKIYCSMILCLFLLGVLSGKADASIISGLYNTGMGTTGSVDPHYTVNTNGQILIGRAPGLGVDFWQYPTNPQAEWIYLTGSTANPQPPFYTYNLQFNLAGYDPASASFSVRWMMDNAGYVTLNGYEIPGSRSGGLGSNSYYQYLEPNHYGFSAGNEKVFSNSSFFQPGMNRLDFVVLDGGGVTGLYVEFTGSSVNAVPIPAAFWLLGSGLIGLVTVRSKLK